ncbi:hypothetical protein [Macellibacteroides fermentans]|uniref:hypothetical protein n=1 Tax=Macellibacteroides fermentans TaxID=879969 RepID=UPI00406BE52A
MEQTVYPKCLRNCNNNLQLGNVYLRYYGRDIPNLITLYEIEKPLFYAYTEIKNISNEIANKELSDYIIKGLFTLAIAHFETMLSDFSKKILQFYPQKLSLFKKENITLSVNNLNDGRLISQIIENEMNRIFYSNLNEQIKILQKISGIQIDSNILDIDRLIEIKETRNLLLHNNLIVNDLYLDKTKSVKRAHEKGDAINIDKEYFEKSILHILRVLENIIDQVREKYKHNSLIKLLVKVWRFTFKNEIIKIEDFCTLNYIEDTIDGPFNFPTFLSSSEKSKPSVNSVLKI